jgi:hypothetical protein
MRLWMIAAALALAAGSSSAETVSASQRALLEGLAANDLKAYLDGGKAVYSSDWEKVALPWSDDKDIGMRYARGAIAADSFYGDRTIFIHGRYLSADNWIGDAYRVQLWLLAAIVDKDKAGFLGDARSGSAVSLACRAQGQELQTAYVRDCESADVAIRNLASQQATLLLARHSPEDQTALAVARALDARIPADAPCRRDGSGCEDQAQQLVRPPPR